MDKIDYEKIQRKKTFTFNKGRPINRYPIEYFAYKHKDIDLQKPTLFDYIKGVIKD